MTVHAYLSASSSHRWLNCTKAPFLESQVEDSPPSEFALEGTLAHEIGEHILRGTWEERKASLIKEELFYPTMVDEVEIYTGYVEERLAELRSKDRASLLEIEERLDFGDYVPEGFGTGDAVLIGDGVIEVVDLKFGKGVPVSPVENTQLMLYGLGALSAYGYLFDPKEVVLTVAQVRTTGIDSWTIPTQELLDWGRDYVKPKAQLAFDGKGDPVAGDWCRWCKIRSSCRARAEANLKVYEDFKDREHSTLTYEEVSEILTKASSITSWVSDVEGYALDRMMAGDHIPGYKVVAGRSYRRITDPEGLSELLVSKGFEVDDVWRRQIQTIGALEKLVGKKEFGELSSDFVTIPDGKPTIATEDDKRESIIDSLVNVFEFKEN